MSWENWKDLYQFLVGTGILLGVWSISRKVATFEVWGRNVDKELARVDKESASHGTMLQQLGNSLEHIKGRLEDGFTSRNKK